MRHNGKTLPEGIANCKDFLPNQEIGRCAQLYWFQILELFRRTLQLQNSYILVRITTNHLQGEATSIHHLNLNYSN